jgi:hypothetical protein
MNQFERNHNLLSFTCKVPLSSWMAVTITSSCCCTSPSPNKNKRLNADITLWASFAKYLQHHYSSLTSSVFWVFRSTSKSAEMFAQTIIQKSTSWVSVTFPESNVNPHKWVMLAPITITWSSDRSIVNLIQTATSLCYVVYYTPLIRLIMRKGLDCINLELTKEKTLKNEKPRFLLNNLLNKPDY